MKTPQRWRFGCGPFLHPGLLLLGCWAQSVSLCVFTQRWNDGPHGPTLPEPTLSKEMDPPWKPLARPWRLKIFDPENTGRWLSCCLRKTNFLFQNSCLICHQVVLPRHMLVSGIPTAFESFFKGCQFGSNTFFFFAVVPFHSVAVTWMICPSPFTPQSGDSDHTQARCMAHTPPSPNQDTVIWNLGCPGKSGIYTHCIYRSSTKPWSIFDSNGFSNYKHMGKK